MIPTMCCAWFAWSSHLFVDGQNEFQGQEIPKCLRAACAHLFYSFFLLRFKTWRRWSFFTWSCIVVRQTRFYWRHLNMQDGRYLKVCWALGLSYPHDGLLCCVSALSLVWPLCLLHYISKSHRPTCAAMTASIKGTTSCESMMRVSMWHLCTINLTTPSQPITQRRPLCLLAFGGVLCWRRDFVKPSLYSTVWFLIFLPTELGANQSVTELAVSRGQKPISAVNPLVLLMCCLNSLLQTDWVSSVSELLTPSRSHTAASDRDDAPALYFHVPSKSRDVV